MSFLGNFTAWGISKKMRRKGYLSGGRISKDPLPGIRKKGNGQDSKKVRELIKGVI